MLKLNSLLKLIIKLMRILSSSYFFLIFLKYRVAASVEHMEVLKSLPKLQLIVDIGANKGQFSIIARKIFRYANIYSFEPLKEAGLIYKKIFCSDRKIFFYDFAIGPLRELKTIHVAFKNDSSSLLKISKLQNITYPGTNEISKEIVNVAPLSDFISSTKIPYNSLLKIDVQGYELQVLQSSYNLINRFGWIYVECSFVELYKNQFLAHEIINYLESKNFDLRGIYNPSYNDRGLCIQADFLFCNKKFSSG
jgi:FkbM family methyltransferase